MKVKKIEFKTVIVIDGREHVMSGVTFTNPKKDFKDDDDVIKYTIKRNDRENNKVW